MKNSSTPFWKAAQLDFSWNTLKDYLFILAGTLVQAFAMRLFLIPGQLVSGGISGAAQLINFYTHWPIGLNGINRECPSLLARMATPGRSRFVFRTALAIISFSVFTDLLGLFISANGMTHDLVLTTLYGGLMLGIGLGLVYRGKGTSGGSDILGRILNHRFGISISQAYLMTDSIVVLAAGFVYGWEFALYGLVMIYVSGLAAEIATEGSSVFRTALIVTDHPNRSNRKDHVRYGTRSDHSLWPRAGIPAPSGMCCIAWFPALKYLPSSHWCMRAIRRLLW